jgi:hypothetical protein
MNNNNATDRQQRRQGREVFSTMVLGIMVVMTSVLVVAESASFCELGICGPGESVDFPERLFSYTEMNHGNTNTLFGETFTMSCAEAQDLVDRGPDDDADGTLPIYCDKTTPCSTSFSNAFCNYDVITSGTYIKLL